MFAERVAGRRMRAGDLELVDDLPPELAAAHLLRTTADEYSLEELAGLRLAEGILQNNQLRVCHVGGNKLSSDAAEKFAEVIAKDHSLKEFVREGV